MPLCRLFLHALSPWLFALLGAAACGGRSRDHRTIVLDPPSASGGSNAGRGGTTAGRDPATAGAGGRAGSAGRAGAGGEAGADDSGGAGGEAPLPPCDAGTDGELEIVTLSTACTAADGDSTFSRLSRDGRYVLFDSDAPDLVPNDSNGKSDVFLFDLDTRKLELISSAYGSQAPGGGYAWTGTVSDDARHVVFTGLSYDLVSNVPPEGIWVYVRDREARTTVRLAADYACAYWVDASGDASLVVSEGFTNCSGGLEEEDYDSAFEHDLSSGVTRPLGMTGDRTDNYQPAITRDGRFVVWATRPPGTRGEYTSRLQLYDRATAAVETIPLTAYHFESVDISDDGQVLAFGSNGQIYRYDRGSDLLTLVSADAEGTQGDLFSEQVSMSGDGRFFVFRSRATNLVPDDGNAVADIFLFDFTDATLERVSVAADGTEADEDSIYPSIAAGGTRLSFSSKARNLVPQSSSGNFQTYVRRIVH